MSHALKHYLTGVVFAGDVPVDIEVATVNSLILKSANLVSGMFACTHKSECACVVSSLLPLLKLKR